MLVELVIEQLNVAPGRNREFVEWIHKNKVEQRIRRIQQAYNMDNTIVKVDGKVIENL